MNNSGADWQGQFSQGFASSGGDNSGAIWGILIILGLLVGLWVLYDQVQKYQSRVRKAAPKQTRTVRPTAVAPSQPAFDRIPSPGSARINPLQQRIIYELIDEFRKQETSAQGVPSAVLEKYSDFFFQNVKRLKTSEAEVRDFVKTNYPILEGYGVEMDFLLPGSVHLIKSKVLEVNAKNIMVAYDGVPPAFMRRGTSLMLNYSVGKHFLQGSSTVSEVRKGEGLVLRKPLQVSLTSERRYARVTLKNGTGLLHDPKTSYKTTIKVLDLSLEGVRVQVERPLEKSHIFQLAFEADADGKHWVFGPIECAPSKAFLTNTGAYESGLVFLYLDMATKSRLVAFMKALAQELQDARTTQA